MSKLDREHHVTIHWVGGWVEYSHFLHCGENRNSSCY